VNYGKKYYTPFGDDLGNSWEISLWEVDFSGVAQVVVAANPPFVLTYEGQGKFPFSNPIRGSSCEYTIEAQESGVEYDLEQILEADEGSYRIEILKNSNLFWRGSVLPQLSETEDAAFPLAYTITATCGLGRLDGIPFRDDNAEAYSGRVSKLQIIVDILNKLGQDLPFVTADNWFSTLMTQNLGDDALVQALVDRGIFYDENGLPWMCSDVLKSLLLKKSLHVTQANGAWQIIQQQALKDAAIHVIEYNSSGAFTLAHYVDLRVPYDNLNVRMQQIHHSKSKPLRSAEITYDVTKEFTVRNGDFEEWELPSGSGNMPVGWTVVNGDVERTSIAKTGKYAVKMLPHFNDIYPEPDPATLLRLEFQGSDIGLFAYVSSLKISGSIGYSVRDWSQLFSAPPDDWTPDYEPRHAYVCIRVGDWVLKEAWIPVGGKNTKQVIGWEQTPIDYYVRIECLSGWGDFELNTPVTPFTGGLFSLKITTGVDDGAFADSQAYGYVDNVRWDNVAVEIMSPLEGNAEDDTVDSKTTSCSFDLSSATTDEDLGDTAIGDGPSVATLSRITVAGQDTTLWSRRGLSDDLSLDSLNTLMVLRATWMPNRIIKAGLHADFQAHNTLNFRGAVYAFNGGSFTPNTGWWQGEWRELRDDDVLGIFGGAIERRSGSAVGSHGDVYAGSLAFADGFAGTGFAIRVINGKAIIFCDGLVVRGDIQAASFLIQQIRTFNGSIAIARAGTGKPKKMAEIPL
jgi:hypothetical protein